MVRAEWQAMQLVLALVLGLALGLFYDVYRVWFRGEKSALRRALGDICWWIAALLGVFGGLYWINGAVMRLPVLLAVALGGCLYMWVASPLLLPLIAKIMRLLWRAVLGLWHAFADAITLLLMPLVWVVELAFRILQLLRRILGILLRPVRRIITLIVLPVRKIAANFRHNAEAVVQDDENLPE